MKFICKSILNLLGWKAVGQTDYPLKCVICVAPHTSNFDLLIGLIVNTSLGRKSYFLMKKEWFFFPLGPIFRALGGIPVDRSKKSSLTEQIAEEFSKREKFQIAITPEATRKANPDWKKGFYYIALEAKVPVVVAAIDYKLKVADFKKVLIPSGDVDADLMIIKECYKGVTARHPEKFVM